MAATIPTSLLSGILIKVGLDIIDWGFLLRAHRLSAKTAALMYAVLLMTVFWDLIWGVLVGMFIANLLTVDGITQSQLQWMDDDNHNLGRAGSSKHLNPDEQKIIEDCGNRLMLFRLRGPMSFGAARGINSRIAQLHNYEALLLDISDVPRMGVTAALAVERMIQEAESQGRIAVVAGANQQLTQRLRRFGVDKVMPDRLKALEHIQNVLKR